jgi:hypothetical protein
LYRPLDTRGWPDPMYKGGCDVEIYRHKSSFGSIVRESAHLALAYLRMSFESQARSGRSEIWSSH